MPLIVPIEEIIKLLPKHIAIVESTYKGKKTKCKFIDSEFGEFESIPADVIKGHECRARANRKISASKSKKIDKIKEKLPPFISIKDETYECSYKKCVFVDEKYGEFISTPKRVLRGQYHKKRSSKNPKWNKLSVNDVKKRLPDYIEIDESTYKNTSTKCRFIDVDFGEFWTTPNAMMFRRSNHPNRHKINRQKTVLQRYGVNHTSQCQEIFKKMQKGMRKTLIIKHWKSGNNIECRGSYELKVVKYLNENKIDFDWQIPFTTDDKKTYYCDLYLKERNLYVEIKGWWMRECSKKKWEWFHRTYLNSELWNKDKLKELKIL